MKKESCNMKAIGQYLVLIESQIGQGQFGKVYLAIRKDQKDDHKKNFYACKIIAIQNQLMDQQIINELKVLDQAKHPNLLYLVDKFLTKNNIYLFTHFCEQGTLTNYINNKIQNSKQNTISYSESIYIFKQMLEGYKQLHEQNIIHRDLKPDNILISEGIIKIGDFGFGRIIEGDIETPSKLSFKGTPIWSAPQILAKEQYSSKCDVWSFGVILYQMLYGSLPFVAKTENLLLNQIQQSANGKFTLPLYPKINQTIKQLLCSIFEYKEERRIGFNQLYEYFQIISDNNTIIKKNTDLQSILKFLECDEDDGKITEEDYLQLKISIDNNKNQLSKNLMKSKLFASKNQLEIQQQDSIKTIDIEQYRFLKLRQLQIDQWFNFNNQKILFNCYSFHLLFDNSQKMINNKIELYHILMILYCQYSIYYNQITIFYNCTQKDYLEKLENLQQIMPFTISELLQYFETDEYQQTLATIKEEYEDAKIFYKNISEKIYIKLRFKQNASQEYIHFYGIIHNQQQIDDDSYKRIIESIFSHIVQNIDENLQDLGQLRALYSIKILIRFNEILKQYHFSEFDFYQFYDDLNKLSIEDYLEKLKEDNY